MSSINCAALALTANEDKKSNVEAALAWLEKAVREGSAKWLVLPEVFSCFGSAAAIKSAAEASDGPLAQALGEFAKRHKVTIFGGSFQEVAAGTDKVYNNMMVFGPSGAVIAKYRKAHLFSLSDQGGKALYDETLSYHAGDELCAFQHEGWNIWLAICYDLRFPGFFEALYKQAGAPDVIVIPAAFTYQTGKDHWLTLLRARAIEYQCYVVAANQVGYHDEKKRSYGHSVVINPWGEILANTHDEIGFAAAPISKDEIAAVRSRLPSLNNRRHDIY